MPITDNQLIIVFQQLQHLKAWINALGQRQQGQFDVKNWNLFEQPFSVVAPLAVALNVLMLALGFDVAKIGRLERRQAVTIAIETAMQNATLAIVIGSTVLQDDSLTVLAAIYGVLMYVGGLACAFAVRL